jgi:hypothetical protein
MSKRPAFYLIKGGLTEERHGIYRLRERQAAATRGGKVAVGRRMAQAHPQPDQESHQGE